jgi:hypothetical protein
MLLANSELLGEKSLAFQSLEGHPTSMSTGASASRTPEELMQLDYKLDIDSPQ